MLAAITLAAACGGKNGTEMPPPPDAGTAPLRDAGTQEDSGPPAPPPYRATPLSCQGTAPACSTYDESRTRCNEVVGCNYGRCEYRELSCIAFYSYTCESGCEWDYFRERCSRISGGCNRTSPDSCHELAACRWSSTNTSIFDNNRCLGISTPCDALSATSCETQLGCSVGCPSGREQCGSSCVDLMQDNDHCGDCELACGAGASCVDGVCECETPGHSRDACGVCDADPTNDCVVDCSGTPGGTATVDDCGTCDANPLNDCDCAGTPGGVATTDMCGTCDSNTSNDCVQDCAGQWGGAATTDLCDICDSDPSNDCDCLLVPGGDAVMDQCGVCDADPNNDCMIDCSGVWGGSDRLDECGTCDADPSNDCVQDCAGTWGGSATVDNCDVCDTDPSNDCEQDCAGTWGGSATVDNCDVCDTDPSNDCVCRGVPCTTSVPCYEGFCDPDSDVCQVRPAADGSACGDVGTGVCHDRVCLCEPLMTSASIAISDSATAVETYPHVARVGSVYGVAWEDSTNLEVHFRTFDEAGAPLSPTVSWDARNVEYRGVSLIASPSEFAVSMHALHTSGTPERLLLVSRIGTDAAIIDTNEFDIELVDGDAVWFHTSIAWAPGAGYAACSALARRCAVFGPGADTAPATTFRTYERPRIAGAPDGTFGIIDFYFDAVGHTRLDAAGALHTARVEVDIPTVGSVRRTLWPRYHFSYHEGVPLVLVGTTYRLSTQWQDVVMLRGHQLEAIDFIFERSENWSSGVGRVSRVTADLRGDEAFILMSGQPGLDPGQARYLARVRIPPLATQPIASLTPMTLLSSSVNVNEWYGDVAVSSTGGLSAFMVLADGEDDVHVAPLSMHECWSER